MSKKQARIRRAASGRYHMKNLGVNRLVVNRTPRHIYAQVIDDEAGVTLAAASSLQKAVDAAGKKIDVAKQVGLVLAEACKGKEISQVAFDRSGFRYHGRVRAVAEGAREGGLEF